MIRVYHSYSLKLQIKIKKLIKKWSIIHIGKVNKVGYN